jgi:hypothetical protein
VGRSPIPAAASLFPAAILPMCIIYYQVSILLFYRPIYVYVLRIYALTSIPSSPPTNSLSPPIIIFSCNSLEEETRCSLFAWRFYVSAGILFMYIIHCFVYFVCFFVWLQKSSTSNNLLLMWKKQTKT